MCHRDGRGLRYRRSGVLPRLTIHIFVSAFNHRRLLSGSAVYIPSYYHPLFVKLRQKAVAERLAAEARDQPCRTTWLANDPLATTSREPLP
jgi:hypothetical protein